jgi:hypothetical protein
MGPEPEPEDKKNLANMHKNLVITDNKDGTKTIEGMGVKKTFREG